MPGRRGGGSEDHGPGERGRDEDGPDERGADEHGREDGAWGDGARGDGGPDVPGPVGRGWVGHARGGSPREGRPPAEWEPWEPGAARLAELDSAHRRLRLAAAAIDPVAAREGWPSPFSPVRLLVLRHLRSVSALGAKPSRIARALEMKRSSLAHHLDVLEGAGMIERRPRGFYDGRHVAARLTERGTYALWRLGSTLLPA